jgi:NAD(P)-dependent dehydrogenase (short-subunit alcohol dehydrogenase family)
MRILIVGGTGTIGKEVAKQLSKHEIVVAGSKSGDVQVDITNESSIKKMYELVGKIDAVVITSGIVHFAPIEQMNDELYKIGLNHKLMGQVNVVTIGLNYVNSHGSFTLTSGILNRDPIPFGSSAAMVNGALEGFVIGAAIEMPNGIRINVVSPTVITQSLPIYADYFPGFKSVDVEDVALKYVKSVEGKQTGKVYCLHNNR